MFSIPSPANHYRLKLDSKLKAKSTEHWITKSLISIFDFDQFCLLENDQPNWSKTCLEKASYFKGKAEIDEYACHAGDCSSITRIPGLWQPQRIVLNSSYDIQNVGGWCRKAANGGIKLHRCKSCGQN